MDEHIAKSEFDDQEEENPTLVLCHLLIVLCVEISQPGQQRHNLKCRGYFVSLRILNFESYVLKGLKQQDLMQAPTSVWKILTLVELGFLTVLRKLRRKFSTI